MRQEILTLGKHTLIYGTGIIISRAVSFIMLPVYTRYLTPADYGIMELLFMAIDIIAMIVGLGITGTVFKFYSDYKSPEEKREVICTAIILIFVIASVTAIIGFIVSPNISQVVFGNTDNSYYFQITFVIYFLQAGNNIPLMFIRAMQNSTSFIVINLIKLLIQLSLNLLFLVWFEMGVIGVLYSTLLAELTIASYLHVYTFHKIGFRFSISKGRQMIKFGYPFIFASLSNFVITYSDRYFLNVYSTLTVVGIYSLAYKFGFLMGYLAVTPFMQVWEPQRFEIAKQDKVLPIFKRVFLYFNIFVISVSLFISLFARDFLTIMSDPSYYEAYRIVPIVIIAYVFQAWTFYCNFGIYIKERSKHMAFANFISAMSNILLNFVLILEYGALGAAWATVGSFFIRFLLVYMFSQKSFHIDYGWGKQLLLVILSIFIYMAGRTIEIPGIGISLVKNSFLMLLFGILVYRFILNKLEKSIINQFIRNPVSFVKIAQ
ncbi:MAG: hypothetical protein A2W05_08865 [Candidatus Schekmanbacteria bacterium RBG_16_38_10]|uniref:Uncharacterized protein n=1 Tax=Candidatus Schekmanbacteria bacterium RBG_16_38_10 TaxID=1817879 RepID=A0A1F7RMZ0_9BACT|nr:MAG: hypothetical protein A2W05_08865 [Candidatus Schekmanbacteria bacterium RBG_16_38_10]